MPRIIYQDRDAANTTGGVYTEYEILPGETEADLPTDCRLGSYGYDQAGNALYRFGGAGTWGEIGGTTPASDNDGNGGDDDA